MKAISVFGPGDIGFIDVDKPKVGPKDVLVRVNYCGICGTDIAILNGEMSLIRDGLIKYPVRIGHEWSGIVAEVGIEVFGFKPGDRVVGDDAVVCGNCLPCLEGRYEVCEHIRGVGTVNCWDGAFAEYILMPFRQLYKLPDDFPLEEAALIEPACIAYHGLKQSNLKPGNKILITGTGPIGLAAVGLAKSIGATQILLSGRKQSKLEVGKMMGADQLINITQEGFEPEVKKASPGGVDIILESSGDITVINQCLQVIKPGGTIILVGFYEKKLVGFDIDKIVINNITVKGVSGTPNVFPAVIDLLKAGRLTLKPLITGVFPFARFVDAIHEVTENAVRIKVLVKI